MANSQGKAAPHKGQQSSTIPSSASAEASGHLEIAETKLTMGQ